MPGSTIRQLLLQAASRLSGSPNPALDAETLFRGLSGMDRAGVLAGGDDPVPDALAARFAAAVARRERGEPIQYILGTAAFWRDEFRVTPAVLIPRPDTEILVEAVSARLRDHPNPHILDVGTGSGCVALSLLRELNDAQALGVDISDDALEVAATNARDLRLEHRIRFLRSNWFSALDPGSRFDAVVSNPPYVARTDASSLAAEVREFEPSLALFAEPLDDLSSYRAILAGASRHLQASGLLAVEVGLGQAERVAALLDEAGFGGVLKLNDLAGIPRVVVGRGR